MKKEQLKKLLIALGILALLALILVWRDAASWQVQPEAAKNRLLPKFDPKEISRIIIASRNNKAELVKRNGVWLIPSEYNYPADYPGLVALVRQLEELRPLQRLSADKSQYAQLGLAETEPGVTPEFGVLLELQDKAGKRLAAMVLGKLKLQENETVSLLTQPVPVGRYVLVLDGKSKPMLLSETFEQIIPVGSHWIRKDSFSIENPSLIVFPAGKTNKALSLSRKSVTEKFSSDPAARLDDAKVGQLLGVLAGGLALDGVQPLDKLPEIKAIPPIQIKTFDGFEYKLRVLSKNGKAYLWGESSATLAAGLPEEKEIMLQNRIKAECRLASWVCEIPDKSAQALLNARSELVDNKH